MKSLDFARALVPLVLWLLLQRLQALDTSELEKLLAQSVADALHNARICTKEAAGAMGISDSLLARQLRGEPGQHLSLTKLIRLPWEFWLWFGPTLMWLVAKKRINELADEVSRSKRGA